jgi:hypothetical protein
MEHYIIWRDGKKADGKLYSVLDAVTRRPVLGENGDPLTDLSFKQVMNLFETLKQQQESRSGARPIAVAEKS